MFCVHMGETPYLCELEIFSSDILRIIYFNGGKELSRLFDSNTTIQPVVSKTNSDILQTKSSHRGKTIYLL